MLNRELLFLHPHSIKKMMACIPTTVFATLVHVLLIIPQKLSILLEKMKDDHSQTKVYLFLSMLAGE